MVGEIRDRETARIAIQASLTGHLDSLSTLHTNDAASAATRLVGHGRRAVPGGVSAVVGVLAQRLVRRSCARNAERPYEASADELSRLEIFPRAKLEGMLYRATGCRRLFGTLRPPRADRLYDGAVDTTETKCGA